MSLILALDVVLAVLLTMRLTRVVIGDKIGLWLVRGPIAATANGAPLGTPKFRFWSKMYDLVTCPFCIGFWIGCLVLASLAAVGGPGDAAVLWRYVAGVFALNYVAAHIGARLGDNDN